MQSAVTDTSIRPNGNGTATQNSATTATAAAETQGYDTDTLHELCDAHIEAGANLTAARLGMLKLKPGTDVQALVRELEAREVVAEQRLRTYLASLTPPKPKSFFRILIRLLLIPFSIPQIIQRMKERARDEEVVRQARQAALDRFIDAHDDPLPEDICERALQGFRKMDQHDFYGSHWNKIRAEVVGRFRDTWHCDARAVEVRLIYTHKEWHDAATAMQGEFVAHNTGKICPRCGKFGWKGGHLNEETREWE